ncbi:MAG: hypothetical protein E4H02_00730 [Lentisphaerales bacterium]|jgi:hypothetical protein|nr:MAG: hypothetical protein E4H02_00730 [Lentisphaerales bacterium]
MRTSALFCSLQVSVGEFAIKMRASNTGVGPVHMARSILLVLACLVAGVCLAANEDDAVMLKAESFQYEDIEQPLIGSSIPDLSLRDMNNTGYMAFQYGLSAKEVVYLVLDYNPGKGLYDRMYIYAPASESYAKPFLVRGSRGKGVAVEFKRFGLESSIAGIDIVYEITMRTDGITSKPIINCRMRRARRQLCRFDLTMRLNIDLGIDRPARIIRLVEYPRATCVLDHRSSPPKLAGQLKMGRWTLLPESGMPCKVRATLTDEDGRFIVKDRMKLDMEDDGRFRLGPYRPLVPGKRYTASVSVWLGSPFGELQTVENVRAKKL